MPKIKPRYRPVTDFDPVVRRIPKFLYHATRRDYLEDIELFGLVPGFRKGIPFWQKDPRYIWLDNDPKGSLKWLREDYPDYDWTTVKIDTSYLDKNKLKVKYIISKGKRHRWYVYPDDIPPEAIRRR